MRERLAELAADPSSAVKHRVRNFDRRLSVLIDVLERCLNQVRS
jgi:hypothetical protein